MRFPQTLENADCQDCFRRRMYEAITDKRASGNRLLVYNWPAPHNVQCGGRSSITTTKQD